MTRDSSNQRADGIPGAGLLLDGRYRIVRLLGEGGMGAVFLAEHAALGRRVAIKFLHADYVAKEEMVTRFLREAQAAAAIHHRNIIDVFDVGTSARGEPYLVMEYLEGESLADLLKRTGTLNLDAACAILEQALTALQVAHHKGIIHRDLKPDNLFLAYLAGEPPVVKLIDFGISKFTQGDYEKWRTKTGSLLGTPAYMSPEQARALPGLDHRSDLYSMGTILYEMLTGALPFEASTFSEFIAKLITEEPRSPLTVCADFPKEAEAIVAKALAKDPAARFQTADEMLEALRSLGSIEDRLERLSKIASTIRTRGFAAGDLGQLQVSKAVEAGVRAQGQPWWDVSAVVAPPPRQRPRLWLDALAALVIVSAAGAWWLLGRASSTPPAAPTVPAAPLAPVPPPRPEPSVVAPEGPEPSVLLPADHEAAGVPVQDDSDKRGPEPTPGTKVRHKLRRPAAATPSAGTDSSASKRASKPALRSGSRGTKMSESFE